MFKLFVILYALYSPCAPNSTTQKAPRALPFSGWADRLMFTHLINLTADIVKDTTYKLRHAEKIKEMHAGSVTFELGFIAAGIQERFHRMLETYRKYANMKEFTKGTYTIQELMNAYHVIQGDYNEIRLEKGIFHEIVRKKETVVRIGTLPPHVVSGIPAIKGLPKWFLLKDFTLPPGHTLAVDNFPPSDNLQGYDYRQIMSIKRRAPKWRPNNENYYDFPVD